MLIPVHQNIGLVMHKMPDADALASAAVLLKLFKKHYPEKNVFIAADHKFKFKFPFDIPYFDTFITSENLPEDTELFLLDHSERQYSLLDDGDHENIKKITLIDHHNTYAEYAPEGTFVFRDTEATSTCEMLYDYLINQTIYEITSDIATLLYMGIYCDTIYFYTSFNKDLLGKIYRLVFVYGADIDGASFISQGRFFYYQKLVAKVGMFNIYKNKVPGNIVEIRIKHDLLESLKAKMVNIPMICIDALLTRGTDHVICMYEKKKDLGSMRVVSRNKEAIKSCFTNPVHHHVVLLHNLTFEESKKHQKEVFNRLKNFDMRHNNDKMKFHQANEFGGHPIQD